MSQREIPICYWCKHYRETNMVNGEPKETCDAFNEGIPSEIMVWTLYEQAYFDHRYPHPNDDGIQFELEDDITKLRHRFPISLDLKKGEDKAYRHLHYLFKMYDERYEAGHMKPQIR